jgi:glycosyltransferase involved in cell wall biosynthesis
MPKSAKPKDAREDARALKMFVVAMIRNEGDIVDAFLSQATSLFDRLFVVDIQSTDGTRERLESFTRAGDGKMALFNCRMQEKYQAAMMNTLARKAFDEGADWVFFLDADEFLAIEDRSQLNDFLRNCDDDVIHLPWINLVPSEYGSFEHFDIAQRCYWSGQVAPVCKVAVSSRYALLNPDFSIDEGNHNVSKTISSHPEYVRPAFPILHLPVRSAQRLKYKLTLAERLLARKHYRQEGEGHHVKTTLERLEDSEVTSELLDSIAANYGLADNDKGARAVARARWPTRWLPQQAQRPADATSEARSLAETLRRDAELKWERQNFAEGAPVCAEIVGSEISIRSLPMMRYDAPYFDRYRGLGAEPPPSQLALDAALLVDAVAVSGPVVDRWGETEDADAIPLLAALFSLLRPRRLVALGVRDSAGFFAACEASALLKTGTECVGVDAWVGDFGQGVDNEEAFEQFRRTLDGRFPSQHYIRAKFSDAIKCFDDQSIDALVVDASATFGATRDDIEAWLPKLSGVGTIALCGVDGERQGRSGWRLWAELRAKRSGYVFYRCGGVGVIYAGAKSGAAYQAISILGSEQEYAILARILLERLGRRPSGLIPSEPPRVIYRESDVLSANSIARDVRAYLRRKRLATYARLGVFYPLPRNRRHYCEILKQLNGAIDRLDERFGGAGSRAERRRGLSRLFGRRQVSGEQSAANRSEESVRRDEKPAARPTVGRYVVFDPRHAAEGAERGLHKNVKLIIPTRGCAKWLPYFLEAYRALGFEPAYAVDRGCEPETLALLEQNHAEAIFIDANDIRNGESIMPYLSKRVSEDYVFRLDDDEFPTGELLRWVNSIPDSQYAFVTSWWLPRYEVAWLDGRLRSCHPKWLRTKLGSRQYENLHGGRFYRHKDVEYDKVGPHHGNFISEYVSHAPPGALIIHFDYLVRTVQERLDKLRSTEQRFKDAGWPFANHVMPELAPRELLRPRDFDHPDLRPLVGKLLEKVYRPTEELTLKLSEIVAIQQDRLTHDTMHFHY